MQLLDWTILIGTLSFIVFYGYYKSKGSKNVKDYLLANNESKWWTVGLSVMATQASAITFLSTPGQAFHDGMGFVQFYFGMPLAMVVICVTFIPIFHKLKVYTAYEFLENRFDLKTRSLAAILFLIQRGLAAGITIYAPAIILSSILGWNLKVLNILIGTMVIIYTVSGGTKAVSVTQKQQMFVIMMGMFAAFYFIVSQLPEEVSFANALQLAGASDKMKIIDFSFDLDNRYTIWSGTLGAFFLFLSYFGTDQSQVQRYLSAKSVRESRMGLLFNAAIKIPMQFFILLVGVMVFIFFQFQSAPLNFSPAANEVVKNSEYAQQYTDLELVYAGMQRRKMELNMNYLQAIENQTDDREALKNNMGQITTKEKQIREEAKELISAANKSTETNDKDYVFIYYILNYLPSGLIGLLLAVIFSAAMSSTASELNALASTTVMDIYKRNLKTEKGETHYLNASKWFTVMWGLIAILFASFGTLFENLIQFVNIVGSIFYGTILGIFLVAFYVKSIKGASVFWAALLSEILVIAVFFQDILSYLWLNVLGVFLTVLMAFILQQFNNFRHRQLTA
ncbi:MAG: sodium:solute symporter [Flavobacteriaceae bacterium]|nr:sodium:solute symporter [Flavobacteriaceae bacterium]